MSISHLLQGENIEWKDLIVKAGITGSLIGLGLTFMNVSPIKDIAAADFKEESLSTHQRARIISSIELSSLKEHLEKNNPLKFKRIEIEGNSIKTKIGMSASSWGEHVHIHKDPQGGYLIESYPVLKLAWADWGKNLENVKKLTRYIASLKA